MEQNKGNLPGQSSSSSSREMRPKLGRGHRVEALAAQAPCHGSKGLGSPIFLGICGAKGQGAGQGQTQYKLLLHPTPPGGPQGSGLIS